MDPVSHGLLGATAAFALLGGRIGRRAAVAGLVGGLIPDADIFLTPVSDPALPFELHRHFTHAIVLAPVFGALRGTVHMADDFDAPLDDFADYER